MPDYPTINIMFGFDVWFQFVAAIGIFLVIRWVVGILS